MDSNFTLGIVAIAKDIALFAGNIFTNTQILGFLVGFVISVLATGFILSKNPRHLPIILKYSMLESFERIVKREHPRLQHASFENFIKMYVEIRTIFFVALISFCIMVITIVLVYKP